MKKSIALILSIILCFSMISCNNADETVDNAIQLNLENYNDYFDINATTQAASTETWKAVPSNPDSYITTCKGVNFEIDITGNSHYKYSNVEIDIKVSHFTLHGELARLNGEPVEPFSQKAFTLQLNLSGNGSGTCYLDTPSGTDYRNNAPPNCPCLLDVIHYSSSDAIHDYTHFEITAVRGTVQEY